MPANFTKEEREILIEKFYKQGYILLKNFGYKKLKVADIAASVGIGTGTFYNFFKSKDESLQQFSELSKKYPKGTPMKAMEKYLFDTISNRNV